MGYSLVDPIDKFFLRISGAEGWPIYLFMRLMMAVIAGGLVGLERELRGRQAGFRTNLLVALGSALVMIVSVTFASADWSGHSPGININIDPARIAYGVMTGVGFLGAGTIVKTGGSVRGLTTAAGLWCTAAIGLAAGFGLYVLAIMTSFLVLLALWILDYFEDALPKLRYRNVVIRRMWGPGCITQTIARFKEAKLSVVDATFVRTDDLHSVDITVRIAFTNKKMYYSLERQLEGDTNYELMSTSES